ncbi:MAG: RDD family protein [Rhodobacteraceae bacterium]|nr:RDD family protein [Paracoccaceae bacterium]
MTYVLHSAQPDPIRHAEFYEGVTFRRAVAFVIDLVVIGLLTALAVMISALVALFFLPATVLVISFLYRWVTLAGGSATLGMRAAGITFLDRYGQPFDAGVALAHTLGYSMAMAFVLPQILSVALMCLSARGQGLVDLVLGSVAIRSASPY